MLSIQPRSLGFGGIFIFNKMISSSLSPYLLNMIFWKIALLFSGNNCFQRNRFTYQVFSLVNYFAEFLLGLEQIGLQSPNDGIVCLSFLLQHIFILKIY